MDNTYFVSSEGLKGNGKDSYHFSSESYQEFGRRYAEEMLKHISTVPVEPEPQTPFKGKAFDIPGKIEVEDFDVPGKGAGNDSYKETDTEDRGKTNYREGTGVDIYQKATGYVVGYNQEGEWLEYTVNVKEAGDYTMFAAVAAAGSTSSFQLSLDGKEITEEISVPAASSGEDNYDDYNLVKSNVTLPAGEHVLRFTVVGAWLDVDYFSFVKGKDASEPGTTEITHKVRYDVQSEQLYRVYGLNGNFVGTVFAASASEAQSKVRSMVSEKGVYLIRAKNGMVRRFTVTK